MTFKLLRFKLIKELIIFKSLRILSITFIRI